MESNRARHRLSRDQRLGREAGITVIGLLLAVVVVGALGLAGLRIVPLYLERMKIDTVLDDVQKELATGGNTVGGILNALESHFYIEAVTVDQKDIEVKREGEGFVVRINKELRAPFVADLWFMVMLDEQVQISR
jgi:hypothetical protein